MFTMWVTWAASVVCTPVVDKGAETDVGAACAAWIWTRSAADTAPVHSARAPMRAARARRIIPVLAVSTPKI
jgi:hypothetical protein